MPTWGAPFDPLLFATDAEGANATDDGGFGVVGIPVNQEVAHAIFEHGVRPGKT